MPSRVHVYSRFQSHELIDDRYDSNLAVSSKIILNLIISEILVQDGDIRDTLELIFSHRHTTRIATYGTIPSEGNAEAS